MDFGLEDLPWWQDITNELDPNEHCISSSGNTEITSQHDGFVNDPVFSVDPSELQLTPGQVPTHAGLNDSSLGPEEAVVSSPSMDHVERICAMDEFFRSQGGWRPPVPCTHCRRLRLQCFMLQTTESNPNPVTSCSSCVALYRQCSLSGPEKRQASVFETPRPVIGQLHGVYEHETTQFASDTGTGQRLVDAADINMPVKTSKRSSSRSNTGTRPLRIWFSEHVQRPYPTEKEKENLAQQSGLSRTQVANWFSNARRRKKQSKQATATASASREIFRQGSPMPNSRVSHMTPLERWQQSPPDEEPAQFADIELALGSSTANSLDMLQDNSDAWNPFLSLSEYGSSAEWLSLPASLDSSSNATSPCNSQQSRGARSTSSKRSLGEAMSDDEPRKRRARSKQSPYQCTDCTRTFTRRSDLSRHDKAIHLRISDAWVCSDLVPPGESPTMWRVSQSGPECAYCGHLRPDDAHILSHEFVACADRAVSNRTFTRKDHLWQHLYKFHKCRKWDGWTLDENIERLRQNR